MRSIKVEGIVIKRRNFGESDRLITVLTKYHGKLHIKASGVRKITSRRSAHIELLNHATMTLHSTASYPILTEAESMNDFSNIKNDLTKVGLAYHVCELIEGLCPEGQDHRAVFELLKKTLEQLSGSYLFPSANDSVIASETRDPQHDTLNGGDFFPAERDRNDKLSDHESITTVIHEFEVELLSLLGYWHGQPEMAAKLDTQDFIENIIERKLRSKRVFSKIV